MRKRVKQFLKTRFPLLVRTRDAVRTARDFVRAMKVPTEAHEPSPAPPSPTSAPVTPEVNAPRPGEETRLAGANRADDIEAPVLRTEEVQEVLDDMVRPALQADGGDITLVKIEDNDVYVTLIGACSTCPSSIVTMRMGVERLLKEEFPHMRELIQIDSAGIA